jgi:hypothetical protein
LGVIDSLTKGFQSVHRRWWLLLIPVLLDAFLWIGPQASIETLVPDIVQSLEAYTSSLPSSPDGTVDTAEMLDEIQAGIASRYNGFSALRVGILGVPSLLMWGGTLLGSSSSYEMLWVIFLGMFDMTDVLVSVSDASFVHPPVWQLSNVFVWLLSLLAITAIGIGIGSVYVTSISSSLEEPSESALFWRRVLRFGARLVFFWIVRTVALVAVGFPLGMILIVVILLWEPLGLFLAMLVLSLLMWAAFYTIFVVASLAVNDVSIWRAIWNSFNVVLRNFWATFGLFILINLIGGGLTILWQQLSKGSLLTFVGIVGNAYIGTALVAASFLFYLDRYTRWRENMAELIRRRQRSA